MIQFLRVPNYIRERYISWKGDNKFGRKLWLDRAGVGEGYYYNDVDDTGTTFNLTQHKKILQVTGIPVSINFLYPAINQALAILVQTRPSTRTISTDGRAKQHAAVLDKMKHGVLYNSSAPLEIENILKDTLVSGMGCGMIIPSSIYQNGMFGVSFVHVPYDEVILDINAKKRTLEDMEGFFIEKVFTIPKTMQVYGDILANLKDENGNPVAIESLQDDVWVENYVTEKQDITTLQYNQEGRIVLREYYEKIYTNMYVVPDPETGNYQYLFAENLDGEGQAILASAVQTFPGIYIKRTIMMGDWSVYTEVMPITQYPLKVMFYEWGGRAYRSYGIPHFTKDMQAAIDKLFQTMLLNGMLSNNAGWTAPKGTIPEEDRHKWENYGLDPRVIKEYNPKETANGDVLKPERDKVESLSNFYPMLLDMLKNGIEYSTGITAILQGNAKEAGVEVFSALQQYQNAAMMRMVMSTSHINQTLAEIGQVLTEYLTASITPSTYQFFDDKGNLDELKIAQEISNDIKLYRYMVISVPASYMPSQRLAISTELMKIAQSSPDATERSLFTQTAMDLTEIREFDDLREKIDVVKNTESKLNNLQTAYDRLMETSKQMENKYINSQLENKILKELMGREKQIAETYTEMQTKLKILGDSQKPKEQTTK